MHAQNRPILGGHAHLATRGPLGWNWKEWKGGGTQEGTGWIILGGQTRENASPAGSISSAGGHPREAIQ